MIILRKYAFSKTVSRQTPPLSRDSFWNVMFCVGIVPEKWSAEQKINWLELNLSNQLIRESDYTRGINSLKYIFGRHWFSDHTLSIDITFLANMIVTRSKCVQVAHCQSCLHQLASSSRKPVAGHLTGFGGYVLRRTRAYGCFARQENSFHKGWPGQTCPWRDGVFEMRWFVRDSCGQSQVPSKSFRK